MEERILVQIDKNPLSSVDIMLSRNNNKELEIIERVRRDGLLEILNQDLDSEYKSVVSRIS